MNGAQPVRPPDDSGASHASVNQGLVEAIAQRVVELLSERPAPGLLSPGQLAVRLGRSAEWVRDHADELGAMRVGEGPRPRLWFDLDEVMKRLTSRSDGERSQKPQSPVRAGRSARRRQSALGTGSGLLPIRGGEGGRRAA